MSEKTVIDNLQENALNKDQSDQEELLLIITACGGSKKIAEELLKWYTI